MTFFDTPTPRGTPPLCPSRGDTSGSRLARVVSLVWRQGGVVAAGMGARAGYLALAGAVVYAVVDLQSDRLVVVYTQAIAALPGAGLTSVDLQEPIRAGERLAVMYALVGVWPALCYHVWAACREVVAAPTRPVWTRRLVWWAVSGPVQLYIATAVLWPWVAEALALLAVESLPGDLAGAGSMGGVRLTNAVDLALAVLWATVAARALPSARFWMGYAGGWTGGSVRLARRWTMVGALVVAYGVLPTGLSHRVMAWTLVVAGLEVVWYHWSLAGPRQAYWMSRLVGIPREVWLSQSPAGRRDSPL